MRINVKNQANRNYWIVVTVFVAIKLLLHFLE